MLYGCPSRIIWYWMSASCDNVTAAPPNKYVVTLKERLLIGWKYNTGIEVYAGSDDTIYEQRADSISQKFQALSEQKNKLGVPVATYHVGLVGFGCKLLRDAVLAVLRYYLKPKLIHASMLTETRWEGFLTIRLPTCESAIEQLETICQDFACGLILIPLDGFLDNQMVSCLERIAKGSCIWGNYLTRGNSHFRAMLSDIYIQRAEQQARQHVLNVTGLEFTPQNMIRAHHQNSEEARYWRRTNNRHVREHRLYTNNVIARLNALIQNSTAFRDRIQQNSMEHNSMVGEETFEMTQAFLLNTEIQMGAIINSRSDFFIGPDQYDDQPAYSSRGNIPHPSHSVWSYPEQANTNTREGRENLWAFPEVHQFSDFDLLDDLNHLTGAQADVSVRRGIPPYVDVIPNTTRPPSPSGPIALLATWSVDESGVVRAEGGEAVMQVE